MQAISRVMSKKDLPSAVSFMKMHGLGNDFVVIDFDVKSGKFGFICGVANFLIKLRNSWDDMGVPLNGVSPSTP